MKSRLALLLLLLTPLLSNADTRYVSCSELNETSNPTYYLSTLSIGDVSLPFNSADPAKSPAATHVKKKLKEKTPQELVCHEFFGKTEKLHILETDSTRFATWYFKDQQIDLKTTVVDYVTMKELALDSELGSGSAANFTGNNSSLPITDVNYGLSTDLNSAAPRAHMSWMIVGLTGIGVLSHVMGYQEAAMLFSAISLISSSKAVSALVLSAAVSYMAYNLFLSRVYNINEYVKYDSEGGHYYIASEELYDSLAEADFTHVDNGMAIWEQHGEALNAEYKNIFEHYKSNLNGGEYYGSWIGDEKNSDKSELSEHVRQDYEKFRDQHKSLQSGVDLSTVATNSALATFGLILKKLSYFPSLGLAAATVTQEALNYGLDYYCGGYWEEACLGFWHYNGRKDLSSPTNTKYALKRVGTRHLIPTLTVLFFSVRYMVGF